MVRLHVFNLAICRATRAATGLQLQNCPSQLLVNQKRFVDSGPYQWMVELRMLMCKLKALILNATISSHWWGKWYKGQLRMKLKLNSVVKEVLFNAYWLYRRNHCLQTLFLLFECLTRETRESFASRTYVVLVGTLISIDDVSLSIAMASIHYVTVCVSP